MSLTYEPIASSILAGSSSAAVTFINIPQTYTDLVLVVSYQDTRNVLGTDGFITVGNGSIDTTTNYSYTVLRGNGSVATALRSGNANYIHTDGSGQRWTTMIANFQNYSNTTTFKTVLVQDGASNNRVDLVAGLWRSTSAINQIRFSGETGLAAGALLNLYGIKAE
jgi:hypothetical protein